MARFNNYRKSKSVHKRFLHIKEDDDFKKLGKEILINQFKNQKIRYSERNIKTVIDKLNIKNIDELFKSIGSGKITSDKIISSMFPEKKFIERKITRLFF